MDVYVATRDRIKLWAVRDVFAEWHRNVEVHVGAVDPPSGLPEQPLADDVTRGAIHVLSDGRLDRHRIALDAVRMAPGSARGSWGEGPRPDRGAGAVVPEGSDRGVAASGQTPGGSVTAIL